MEFKTGDDAVHPSYGVGNIVRLEERELATSSMRWYYVLAIGTATVWVPVQEDGSTILRAVTPKQDLEEYRTLLSSRPTVLDRDYKKRRLELLDRLTHSSFRVMCEVVRDLTAFGWERPTGETDATLLKKIRANLWREWAAATGQSAQDAMQEVGALLLAGQTTYKAKPMTASAALS